MCPGHLGWTGTSHTPLSGFDGCDKIQSMLEHLNMLPAPNLSFQSQPLYPVRTSF